MPSLEIEAPTPFTIQVSVTSGAILAGASDEDIKQCEIFATKIGLAFQSKCLTCDIN